MHIRVVQKANVVENLPPKNMKRIHFGIDEFH